jgi:hypothetical protein
MEYKILVASTKNGDGLQRIEQYVQEHLDKGWIPCGGVSVFIKPNGDPYIMQAMTRTKKVVRIVE